MEKYKSQYPTLRQSKTKWSKPSIVAKQGEGPSHDWYDMMRKDAKAKLAASILRGSTGKVHNGLWKESSEDLIYHVTHTHHVPEIQKHGILPMKTSNWVKAGNKKRYGGGEVYAFTHKKDAEQWAGRMEWAHHQTLGSGKISIVTAKRPSDREFEVDHNDPLSQAGKHGDWLKTRGSIMPHHIVSVEPYKPRKLGEDRIGKPTPSAEQIAKKHNVATDAIEAQIAKGIAVEREHTNNDQEAAEIARDHLDEFPDYYDRLGKMEKKAKSDMKEDLGSVQALLGSTAAAVVAGATFGPSMEYIKNKIKARKVLKGKKKSVKESYDPDVEQVRNRIEAHKKVAEKMAQQHGEHSQEAAFHRAYVRHMQKQLKDQGIEEGYLPVTKRRWRGRLGKIDQSQLKQELPPKTPHPVPKGFKRVKDGSFNVLKKVDEMVSVGSGAIAGMPTHSTPEQTPVGGPVLRRKKFAGKTVFVVKPDTFYKSYLGKRKYEHYEKFLEGCEGFEEIRDFGRKHWDEPIILEDETTGAMVYLKYGKK